MSIQLKQAESNYDERPQTYYFKKNFLLPLPKWNTLTPQFRKKAMLTIISGIERENILASILYSIW